MIYIYLSCVHQLKNDQFLTASPKATKKETEKTTHRVAISTACNNLGD